MRRRVLAVALLLSGLGCSSESGATGGEGGAAGPTDLGPASSTDLRPADAGARADLEPAAVPDQGSPAAADGGPGAGDQGLPGGDSGAGGDTDGGGVEPGADGGAPQPCVEPTPFVPPGQPSGWRHLSHALYGLAGANHRGQDVVVTAGSPQLLVGKFAYGMIDKDLKDEDVEVFVQERPPCGPWLSLGTVRTSEEGQYGDQFGITDDGGRVFFTIPADRARPLGRTPVRMLVHGDHSVAAFTLFVVAPGTGTVVFDIDGTLTTADTELFAELFDGGYVPALQAGSPDVARAWAAKGYLLLYLTGRPDFLRRITDRWLLGQGFPAGAVHLTDTTPQAFPTADGVGRYKSEALRSLVDGQRLALYAAYGNAPTDIQAYAAAAIPLERTFIVGPHGGEGGTVALPGYVAHLPTAQAMPAAAVPAPQ